MKLQILAIATTTLMLLTGCSSADSSQDLSSNQIDIDHASICQWAMDPAEQSSHDFFEVTPGDTDRAPSCYYLLTEDQSQVSTAEGFAVHVYRSSEELAERAVIALGPAALADPYLVGGFPAARQMAYGDRWTAHVTVQVTKNDYLEVSRWAPNRRDNDDELLDDAESLVDRIIDRHFS